MTILYGFKFYIWNTCYQNDEFTHNTERCPVIVARNEKAAKAIVEPTLEKGHEQLVHEGLVLRTSGEYIYSIVNFGKATRADYWEFYRPYGEIVRVRRNS